MHMKYGKKNWVFCDDNPAFDGHEALMVTNLGKKSAKIELVFIFEDKEPEDKVFLTLDGQRTTCVRLDKPLGERGLMLGEAVQYTLWVKSNRPVVPALADWMSASQTWHTIALQDVLSKSSGLYMKGDTLRVSPFLLLKLQMCPFPR